MTFSLPEAPLHDDVAPAALPQEHGSHEHGWRTESAHLTSAGEIRYVACAECGARRVDLRGQGGMPATALSHEVCG